MNIFGCRNALSWVVFACACSGTASDLPARSEPSAEICRPVVGARDLGSDPAVVAIDWGGPIVCAGALVAEDVVLTARHCVSDPDTEAACTPAAPPPPPALLEPGSVGVRVTDGGDLSAPRLHARAILAPTVASACGADLALIELEEPVDSVRVLAVDPEGIALGGHVRSVGFASAPAISAGFEKRVRDHVVVVDATPTELLLDEAPCTSGCGGPVLDESNGEIVGVVSRAGPRGDVATRVDAFLAFIEAELARAGPDRPIVGALKEKKGPVDMGANCTAGAGCAAGVCVTDAAKRYCSRSCSPHDHCPSRYRCETSAEGSSVCVGD